MKLIRNVILSILIISVIILPVNAIQASESQVKTATADVASYKDVQGQWFEKWAEVYGYTEVFSSGDNCFNPNQSITRMEFAQMLHRVLGISIKYFAATDISEYYNDVKGSDKGSNELYDLVTCGIIDTKKSFRPNEKLDRDEMIHFIMNALYYSVGNSYAIADADIKKFADDSEIKTDYMNDVYHSAILGLINGRGNSMVNPQEDTTRAEAVTIAGRLTELLNQVKTSVSATASASEENGELILNLSIKNNTDRTVTIDHGYGQIFDFTIQDINGKEIFRWSAGRMFTMMLTTTKIAPGEEAAFSDKIDAQTYALIRNNTSVIKAYIVGTSSDFKINSNGYILSDIS